MITNTTRWCAAVTLAAIAAPAFAQDIQQLRAGPLNEQQVAIGVVSVNPVSLGPVVKDAPYSAEAITEIAQTLSDGNRIERRTSATIARSSSGATRREQQGFALGGFVGQVAQPLVTITDPTSGVHVTLNYELKVAYRMKGGWAGTRIDNAAIAFEPALRSEPGVAIAGRPAQHGTRADGPALSPSASPDGFGAPVIAIEPLAVAVAGSSDSQYKNELLEPRAIDGLRAEGVRSTMTIPAGAVGNQLPIEVIHERWFSPDLQVVLMTRRIDPRFGDTTYRLTNIVRAEPAPDLFKVPSDFRIEEIKP